MAYIHRNEEIELDPIRHYKVLSFRQGLPFFVIAGCFLSVIAGLIRNPLMAQVANSRQQEDYPMCANLDEKEVVFVLFSVFFIPILSDYKSFLEDQKQ